MSGSKEEWRKKTLGPSVGRFPERQSSFHTDSGLVPTSKHKRAS